MGVAALVLVAASLLLTLSAGNIGFQGDDWWILSFPFWHPFPQSVWEYALASRRPMEGLYWIVLYEMFGFHRVPYLLASILLQVLSSVLMGMCLFRMCPQRRDIAIWAVFISFLVPMTSSLLYVLHTDNSRLSMVFFWVSILCMQHGVWGRWWCVPLGVGFYWLSALTYENASLLIFAAPFFVARGLVETRESGQISTVSWRIVGAVLIGFLGFLGLRFWILSGGAVSHVNMMPSLQAVSQYAYTLISFLMAPLVDASRDTGSWYAGIGMALATLALLKLISRRSSHTEDALQESLFQTPLFITVTGASVFLLGATPYLLAGYSSVFGFTSQSRVYSSSSYGIGILLGVLFGTNFHSQVFRQLSRAAGVVLVAFMAVFLFDLRKDWQTAAEIRSDLCRSLIQDVPQLTDFSTLLFLDLQSYLGNRAVIFQGVDGLNEYVKMLYRNRTLQAYFLYPKADPATGISERTALIGPEGVSARGSSPWGASPLDSIILFRRQGSQLIILDSISEKEELLDAQWRGITRVISRTQRILVDGERTNPSVTCLY